MADPSFCFAVRNGEYGPLSCRHVRPLASMSPQLQTPNMGFLLPKSSAITIG